MYFIYIFPIHALVRTPVLVLYSTKKKEPHALGRCVCGVTSGNLAGTPLKQHQLQYLDSYLPNLTVQLPLVLLYTVLRTTVLLLLAVCTMYLIMLFTALQLY